MSVASTLIRPCGAQREKSCQEAPMDKCSSEMAARKVKKGCQVLRSTMQMKCHLRGVVPVFEFARIGLLKGLFGTGQAHSDRATSLARTASHKNANQPGGALFGCQCTHCTFIILPISRVSPLWEALLRARHCIKKC